MEVRKKWQHYRAVRFGGFGSRRLTSTATMYAAVPANDATHQPGTQHSHPAAQQHSNKPDQTNHDAAHADVIDDTVTSWVPNDARHGCHGYGDVSEGDDDSQNQQQQQDGRDAVCMTRLNYDRY